MSLRLSSARLSSALPSASRQTACRALSAGVHIILPWMRERLDPENLDSLSCSLPAWIHICDSDMDERCAHGPSRCALRPHRCVGARPSVFAWGSLLSDGQALTFGTTAAAACRDTEPVSQLQQGFSPEKGALSFQPCPHPDARAAGYGCGDRLTCVPCASLLYLHLHALTWQ